MNERTISKEDLMEMVVEEVGYEVYKGQPPRTKVRGL